MNRFSVFIFVLLSCAWAFTAFGQTTSAPATRLSDEEKWELDTLTNQLADSSRDISTKREAAERLLLRKHAQAAETVRAFLADSTNPVAQVAIADAIARRGGKKEYVEGLMAMLTGAEPSVRSSAAMALITYRNEAVTVELVKLARDGSTDKSVRLVVVHALPRILQKQAVEALVDLMRDKDPAIRDASVEMLRKLTTINDRQQIRAWWEQNRDSDAWLEDLAQRLGRAKADLESDNQLLRERLTSTVLDLYEATAPQQQDSMLVGLLRDPLPEARLAGMKVIQGRIQTGKEVSPAIRSQVRAMLKHVDPEVRKEAALALANLLDAETTTALVERLKVEDVASVQSALVTAIGQSGDVAMAPTILVRLNSRYDSVCESAARALARMAVSQQFQGTQRAAAIRAVTARYRQLESAGISDGVPLREALLGAMEALRDAQFLPMFTLALKDTSATVRLAAVNGVARLGDADQADLLVPLMADADRGVRGVAIVAVAALGGEKYLDVILQHTDSRAEREQAVRQQAWDSVMEILKKAGIETAAKVCDSLKDREDAAPQYIRALQVLVDKMKTSAKGDKLLAKQRQLAAALVKAKRYAEAAEQLGQVYAGMNKKDAQAADVWMEWVDCLLEAGDPAIGKALAEQEDEKAFAAAVKRLNAQVAKLVESSNNLGVVVLLEDTNRQLAGRLNADELGDLRKTLAQCRTQQAQIDQQRVVKDLIPQLLAADESARNRATGELTVMGSRALRPLITELRGNLMGPTPSAAMETAVLAAVKKLAPTYNGYDNTARPSEKAKVLDTWLRQATTTSASF